MADSAGDTLTMCADDEPCRRRRPLMQFNKDVINNSYREAKMEVEDVSEGEKEVTDGLWYPGSRLMLGFTWLKRYAAVRQDTTLAFDRVRTMRAMSQSPSKFRIQESSLRGPDLVNIRKMTAPIVPPLKVREALREQGVCFSPIPPRPGKPVHGSQPDQGVYMPLEGHLKVLMKPTAAVYGEEEGVHLCKLAQSMRSSSDQEPADVHVSPVVSGGALVMCCVFMGLPEPLEALRGLKMQSWYKDQIRPVEEDPGCGARYEEVTPQLAEALSDTIMSNYKRVLHRHREGDNISSGQSGHLRLYAHQIKAIEAIALEDKNVCLCTATSSGKSLAFNLPILSQIDKHPETTALYLYPTKALAQDQLRVLKELVEGTDIVVTTLDGDCDATAREVARSRAQVVLTNPDMVHCSLLPQHKRYQRLLGNLKFVVVDECHTYRGSFGSHVANVIRRLRRAFDWHQNRKECSVERSLRFICCSATIGNPSELMANLTGLRTDAITTIGVDEDGAPRGPRWIVIWSPHDYSQDNKPTTEDAVKDKITAHILNTAVGLGQETSAGFVADTSKLMAALVEMGVRETDPIDQWLSAKPERLVESLRQAEDAPVQWDNEQILPKHLVCADNEVEFRNREDVEKYWPPPQDEELKKAYNAMVDKARKESPFVKRPHSKINLRSIDNRSIKVVTPSADAREGDKQIDDIDYNNAFFYLYPGATYMNQGTEYRIVDLDLRFDRAIARPMKHEYYTKSRDITDVNFLNIEKEAAGEVPYHISGSSVEADVNLRFGRVEICTEVYGYKKFNKQTGKIVETIGGLGLPKVKYYTKATWIEFDKSFAKQWDSGDFRIHLLCDQSDVSTQCPSIDDVRERPYTAVIFDTKIGGIGVALATFGRLNQLFETALDIVTSCDCLDGCPKCVHLPTCGSYNDLIDKRGATILLIGITHLAVALVNVDLYYESLCPYCRDFITEDLSHVMNQPDLEKHINLTFVPYGNAKINEATKTITCQHGRDECRFNFYEGCMIAKGGQDQLNTFRAVSALEGNKKLTDGAAEDASRTFGLNFNAITTCRNSEEAYELQRGFAKTGVSGLLILCLPLVTEEARRDFAEKYVPWIVVNGKHIEREKFAETLCKALNEDPAKCEMAGGRGFLNRPMQEVSEA
ncbi:hypothetical protein FOL47_002094 [Perkinsus chesapeaki]|uniref:Helicase ATP-binding domain-containing protein n=1 Tax=Perkinsus chesapeaki TaxID=330153 RepID=A0A7J6MFU0_PERCH|nr:hypothetical protein FOL47_002094 [Perkinsus chesapeaki]